MADVLSALIPLVAKKSEDLLVQRIGEMWGINDQRERLCNMLLEIQAILPDAEEKANSNAAVKSWLEKLKSAAYDADDLLDEFCYEELRRDAESRGHKVESFFSAFFSFEIPALLPYKMSWKLKKVVGRVDDLVDQMGRFGFVHGRSLQVANRVRTDSLVVESKIVGREGDKEEVVRLLLEGCESDDLMVVPVVGMGGSGKTTLAQLVYNDPRVKEYFNLPLWVCVSEEFNVGYLVKSIIELVDGGCNLSIDNMELLQRRLRQVLSGKRYVLVLDDVWNENVYELEWLRAVLNCGDSGSAIIVTTRSSRVAAIMGTVESYNLSCLNEEDSWSLFHKRAFSKGVKECQELIEIGRKMVHNCRGLPLAINTLGSLMSFKSEVSEWSAVLEESRIWEQRSIKDEVLPVLRLSYDHLPSYMKQCFAFCAVYPKDYEMDKDKLIQFWMANGFIPSDGSNSLEMKGNDIFNELAWRSFFQDVRQVNSSSRQWISYKEYEWAKEHCYHSKTKCKMHDLMHDLAQSIMGDKCQSMSKIPAKLSQPLTNVHHISLRTIPNDYNKAIDCFPSIRSLIVRGYNCNVDSSVNVEFVKSNSLRILEYVGFSVTNLTLRKMKHLRYLELNCPSLPEDISTLYLLQTLKLTDPNLNKLPEGMRYMSSLRHLHISGRCHHIRSMPKDLGQLNCLQTLTTYIVGTDASNGIRQLNNLNNLHGRLRLYNLGIIKHVVDAREANLIAKKNLDDLALCWGMPDPKALKVMHCNPFEVLDALKPCNTLKVLRIKEYRGDKFPIWMTEYQMQNLIELYIIECTECTKIPPVEKLPFLQIIILKHLDKLRHLCNSVEDGEEARVTFPSLKYMELYGLSEFSSWCEGEVGNKSSLIFPEIKRLEVTNCPKLTAMPIVPSLVKMSFRGNKYLSCFATGLATVHYLQSHGNNDSLSFQPRELLLKNYNSIIPVCAKEGEVNVTPTKCPMLNLWKVSISINTSLWFWKCFIFLEFLSILECDNLVYWPKEEFRSLNCLREIEVIDCPNFVGSQMESPVDRSSTEVLLPMLQVLRINVCPNLVEIPKCPTSIQELSIRKCEKLQCLPEWLVSMIGLKNLVIDECNSLNSLPLSIGDLTNLTHLDITHCPKLTYLPEGMERLISLKVLTIGDCSEIRVLPEGLLQQLKNLNVLWIICCPHLKRHFQKDGKYRHLISETCKFKLRW